MRECSCFYNIIIASQTHNSAFSTQHFFLQNSGNSLIIKSTNFNLNGDVFMLRKRQVHLDFHTSEFVPVGDKFNKEQFQSALKAGHIDSITVFSKCHHGWSYHPTEANDKNEVRYPTYEEVYGTKDNAEILIRGEKEE